MATPRLLPPCRGPLDRRSWLKVGGLSLGALVAGVEPSLARLFAAEQAAARRRRSLSKDFSVILFWANGGPSPPPTLHPKPEAPPQIPGALPPPPPHPPGLP